MAGNGQAKRSVTVAIVGAGPAGVGCAVVLRGLGVHDVVLLERHEVGASFERWPAEMRMITPSFTGNAFGLLDLNAVALQTSPAYSLRREHPSGAEYAAYLRAVAEWAELRVFTGVDVRAVAPGGGGFVLDTSRGELAARFVIWAAGEFQYPRRDPFPGAELCLHSADVGSWTQLGRDERVVVGGYESGLDAAVNLSVLGARVRVLDRTPIWDRASPDPSRALSPYTAERVQRAIAGGAIELVGDVSVIAVDRSSAGYTLRAADGRAWNTAAPPLLATGYRGSLALVEQLFELRADGHVLLSEHDESTRTPGLFVAGPGVRQGDVIFCFIYKFRQRFAVIGGAIVERLGLDRAPLDVYRRAGMLLDDPSCCDDDCAC